MVGFCIGEDARDMIPSVRGATQSTDRSSFVCVVPRCDGIVF